MNGLNDEPMAPQTFLYGCVLEAGKEVVFNPEDDDLEHQLDLRMVCVEPGTKDELHMVEVEGQDMEGQKIKAVLVSLKPSVLPSVCLGGFTITPPAVFRLKAGSGPIHISGQHLVMMEADQSFDEDDDDDDDDEESEEEETPVKAKQTPSKQKAPAQNGKSSKPGTPAANQDKTPKGKGNKSPKTPPTPKAVLTIPEIKAKILEAVTKGVTLPKVQPKFENFVKHGHRVSDPKDIAELWKWRQTLKDGK
uniref:Nucleophosmin-like n=1 Tax=Stegastes partitus TaxID=144197 RepID=A0A3B5BET0_9TELE